MRHRHEMEGRPERPLDFGGLFLRRVDLSDTDLHGANFAGAGFAHADLSGSDLAKADLSRASFKHANLRGVNLANARLEGTDLSGADLSGAEGLDGDQLRRAVMDAATRLPAGFRTTGATMPRGGNRGQWRRF